MVIISLNDSVRFVSAFFLYMLLKVFLLLSDIMQQTENLSPFCHTKLRGKR